MENQRMETSQLIDNKRDGGGDRFWERVTVPENVRMKLNGESPAQMEHARAIKAAGGVSLPEDLGPEYPQARMSDTSGDQEWHIDHSSAAKCTDRYVLATTILWMGPKLLVLAIPMLLAHVLPLLVVRIYFSVLPDGTQLVVRSCGFYWAYLLFLFLALPAAALAFLSYLLDCAAYYFFSLLYCFFTCRWCQACKSFEKIKPYRNGPSVVMHLPDIFVALVGQIGRQTVGEVTWMVSCMWLLLPWLKYYVCCNPFIYNLGHRLCQQISTEMADLGGPDNVADKARYIISCTRGDRNTAERIDIWSFVPHYPFPPSDRRWALGLQAGGAKYPGKFTLVVHTTHAHQVVRGASEQLVLSNCCEQPIYRVMLWYNNPYHFLTGWVEASVSNGMPSQPNKCFGGEHPMWLVTGHSPLVADRNSFTGSGMIDAFFDYWLPVFVHEMRRQVLGVEEADRKYQEVHSQDGFSRPLTIVGRNNYEQQHQRTAMDDMEEEAKAENKSMTQPIGRKLAKLADTRIGRKVSLVLQDEDVHAPNRCLFGWSSCTHAAGRRSFPNED